MGSATPSSSTRLRKRRDVLLDCEVLPLADVVGPKLDRELRTLTRGAGGDGQGRILPADRRGGPLRIRGRAQLDGHGVDAVIANPGERDPLVAKQGAVVALHAREKLLDCARDVHLVEEVHTASQIEAQAHRLQPDGAHPARRARHLRQRHQVFLARWTPAARRVPRAAAPPYGTAAPAGPRPGRTPRPGYSSRRAPSSPIRGRLPPSRRDRYGRAAAPVRRRRSSATQTMPRRARRSRPARPSRPGNCASLGSRGLRCS